MSLRHGRKFCSIECRSKDRSRRAIAKNTKAGTWTTANCLQCTKEFSTTNYKLSRSQGKFCCRKCASAFSSNRKSAVCGTCGAEFTVPTSRPTAKYCSRACYAVSLNKGGHLSTNGYRYIVVGGKRYAEHRYAMEQHLGRPLLPGENVHHLDGNKLNNAIENLELWYVGQPSGQRVADRVRAYKDFIERYDNSASPSGREDKQCQQ